MMVGAVTGIIYDPNEDMIVTCSEDRSVAFYTVSDQLCRGIFENIHEGKKLPKFQRLTLDG